MNAVPLHGARAALAGVATVDPRQIAAAAGEIRAALRRPIAPGRIAAVLAETCAAWRDRGWAPRRAAIAAIGAAWGWSAALLDESLDALLQPFTRAALDQFARAARPAGALIGMIMPGNVPGAGMHEVAAAMLSGCGLMLKSATAEPIFFAALARTLRAADPAVGARLATLNWSRADTAASAALRRECDWIAAFGDEPTIAALESAAGMEPAPRALVGFGARHSGAIVAGLERAGAAESGAIAAAIAYDVSLFEQNGCLSPHQVMVEADTARTAREFALRLAAALERSAQRMPPPAQVGMEEAAAVRRARESARWRALGGADVELIEGGGWGDAARWSVIYDDRADFTTSPGYRTVTVARWAGDDELRRRLAPFAGRFEAFALSAPETRADSIRRVLHQLGVTYLCAPGAMQSPPLEWPHGGGVFLARLKGTR